MLSILRPHLTSEYQVKIRPNRRNLYIYVYIEVIMIDRPPCQWHDKGQKESGPWAGEGQGGQAEEEARQGAQENGEEGAPAETTFRV